MGSEADFALTEVLEIENLREDYVLNNLTDDDAIDYELVDPYGAEAESMQDAWIRCPFKAEDELNQQVQELSNLIESFRR